MERFSFYVAVETIDGKTYRSDTEGIREYVNRIFMNSSNIHIDGCWDKIQHWIDNMSDFKNANQKIHITINGKSVYFNPSHVVSITLVRL